MLKINNLTALAIIGGSFIAGRISMGSKLNDAKLRGLEEGIEEGYSRALVELRFSNKITEETFAEFVDRE